VIWASWVALIAIYVRVFYFIVFGTLFTSMASGAVEISTTIIMSVVLLLFIQYGSLEYDRMMRLIKEEKTKTGHELMAFDERAELRKHWGLIVAGSFVGLLAIVGRALFQLLTGPLPTVLSNEAVEALTTVIVVIVFAWFIYIGATEYRQSQVPST
jgi:hypothetical protein